MNPRPAGILFLALLLGTGGGLVTSALAAASPDNLPPGAYRVQQARVIDPSGFGQPMTAVTLLVPAGWQSSGGVIWENKQATCGKNPTRFEWRAASPDGLSAVELLPEETWSGNNLNLPAMQQACPNVTITNIKDFLNWYAGRVRPGARILDYRDRPDIAAPLAHYNRNDSAFGAEMRTWVEAGELLLGGMVNGREVRESLAMAVLFMHNRMPGVMPGEIREFLTISVLPALAVRAPRGQLDFKFCEAIRRSIKSDPQWSALMAEHNQKMAAINSKGATDRHNIRMKTAQEIAEINRQGYANQQASLDRSHERFSQTMREVETYVDPGSQQRVELPNNYGHVWRLNDDSYILTNDANFQPGRDLGVDGRQLEVAR